MKTFLQGIRIYLFFTVLTGVCYPLLVTLIGQGLFNFQSNGSLVYNNQSIVGSELIAQKFKDPKFFWPRPSAVDYSPLPSGASNLGPISLDLKGKVEERAKQGLTDESLFASASGLDPHISLVNAQHQVARIASARGMSEQEVADLMDRLKEKRQLGFLGEERINVLKMNLELEKVR